MTKVTEDEIKHFYKQIKLLLPIFNKNEKRLINDLKSSIGNYILNNENASILDIENHFGTPSEVVASYLGDLDSQVLYRRLNTSAIIKRLIVAIVIIALFVGMIWTLLLYIGYQKAEDSYIDREVITIEDD